ncbi:MAG: hypothetical protein FDZ69_08130 [Deltaproteobacteria bacterium]|nr:MAG: hypothetical protein FDZ69_08130 [Deltaproteobacteria bacterium]
MTNDHDPVETWLPLAAAAEALGSTPLNVLMHIKRGLLAGVEKESGWQVDPASLAALLRQRGEGGAPAVCRSGCSKAGGCKSCG